MKKKGFYLLLLGIVIVIGSLPIQAASLSDDLVALYNFNDGTANDVSGNNNHGTFFAGATTGAGKDGLGLVTSNGSHVQIVNGFGQTNVGDFTVSAWAKFVGPYPSANRAYVVDIYTPSQGPSFWFDGPSTLGTFMSVSGSSEIHDNVGSPNNEWHHIVLSRQGSVISRYYDGVLLGTTNYSSTALSLTSTSYIGTFNGSTGNHFFNGTIDEVGIWRRALDQSEITSLQSTFNITEAAVPEPTTWFMMLLALVSFVAYQRK